MYVYVRCCKNSILLQIDKKTIDNIKLNHVDFEKSML